MKEAPTNDELGQLLEAIEERDDSEVFVSCFSEQDDLLSQWRAYCSGGSGFSIGFDSRMLTNLNGIPEPLTRGWYLLDEPAESIDQVLQYAWPSCDRAEQWVERTPPF